MTGLIIKAIPLVSSALAILFAAVVVWACLCRLTKTDKTVIRSVRWSITMLATVAAFAGGGVVIWGWQPDLVHVALLGAVAAYQVATRKTWVHGVPEWFLHAIEGH